MSFSLPETDLYYLPRDNLDPEKYEEIISPVFAWSNIDSKYVFDDRIHFGFQLINMQKRAFNGYTHQLPPHGPREREKLKNMIYHGEVVMLERFSGAKGQLFYINEHGELICRDPLAFKFHGTQDITHESNRSPRRQQVGRSPHRLPARRFAGLAFVCCCVFMALQPGGLTECRRTSVGLKVFVTSGSG